MSWQATAWASRIKDDRLSVGDRFLLFSLCNYADENWSCYPGIEKLAELTGQSTRTVLRQAARLEGFGYARRERRFTQDGKRTSDRWFIQQPEQATIHGPDHPPSHQVTDCHPAPENDQVTNCHVTNDPSPGDNCVTYIEEGISVENPRGEAPPPPASGAATTTPPDRSDPPAASRPYPNQCERHQSGIHEAPCRSCGQAREEHAAAQQRAARAASAAAATEAKQRAADIAAEISRCRMCDRTGYLDGRPCSHDPRQAERARQAASQIRARLRKEKEAASNAV